MTAQVNVAPPIDPMDVYDKMTLARELFDWMEGLSGAICTALDGGNADRANKLAAVAQYIAYQHREQFERYALDLEVRP